MSREAVPRRVGAFVAFAVVLGAVLALAPGCRACSSFTLPPVEAHLGHGTVAFDGVVTGYVSSRGVLPADEIAHGLLVEVEHVVEGSLGGAQVAVFPLGVDPACNPISREEADLRGQYPKGSRVTVVGALSPEPLAAAPEVRYVATVSQDFGHVGRWPADPPMTAGGFLDFRSFSERYEESRTCDFSAPLAWRNALCYWFEDFQYLKTLRALGSLEPLSSRVELARSLIGYHRFRELGREQAEVLYRTLLRVNHLPRKARRQLLAALKASRGRT